MAQPECQCQPGCVCELASASLSLRLPACQRDLGRADPGMPARGCLPVCCLSKPPGYLREPKVQVTTSLACGATILRTQSADTTSPTYHWSSARRASLGCCVPSSYQLVLGVACLRSAVRSSLPAVQIGSLSPLQASLSRASASAEMPRARDFCAKISPRDHPPRGPKLMQMSRSCL